jgi:6-phosphogluconolactonase (cycloisomerase 2 family)
MKQGGDMENGNVFVQTNEAHANRVLVFRRGMNGELAPVDGATTGGRGDGVPHLTSQGSVVLAQEGRRLLVTNAGSDQLSVFGIASDEIALLDVVATGGAAPKSAAEHGGLVYVLNAGAPSLAGFTLTESGVEPLEGSVRGLTADADPAQVGFTPDGSALVVTERGTNSIVVFPVLADGRLGEPSVTPSSGPTPYGFTFAAGGALVVTEAFGAEKGRAATSSYHVAGSSAEAVSRSVPNGRSEICWAVATNDGRYVFTTNFADGAISRYAVDGDGSITLDDPVAATALEGQTGLRDEDLSRDGRFLYAVDADARRIFGWLVGDSGSLLPVGSWDGLPETVAGLAAG